MKDYGSVSICPGHDGIDVRVVAKTCGTTGANERLGGSGDLGAIGG